MSKEAEDILKSKLSVNDLKALKKHWHIITDNVVNYTKNPSLLDIEKKLNALLMVLLVDKLYFKDLLITTYKRINGMIGEPHIKGEIKKDLLKTDEEKWLYYNAILGFSFGIVLSEIDTYFLFENPRHKKKFTLLSKLSNSTVKFLDNIKIYDQDPEITNNRLLLLQEVKECFKSVADFDELIV